MWTQLIEKRRAWLLIAVIYFLASLALYSYYWFFTDTKLKIIYQNWDGPIHAVLAQTLYKPVLADKNEHAGFLVKANYLTSAFPLYPLAIRAFGFIGYFQAMILVSQLAGLVAIIVFYELVKKYQLSKRPLNLALVFIFLSPRWFIATHTGNSDALFVLFFLLTIYWFFGKKFVKAGLALILAQLTRPQAVIFFAGFVMIFVYRNIFNSKKRLGERCKILMKQWWSFWFSIVGIIIFFGYLKLVQGDFWAFFKGLSKWPHAARFPFEVLIAYHNKHPLMQTFWLENHYWIYFSNLVASLMLIKSKHKWLGILYGVYALSLTLVISMELAHYNTPLIPLQLIAFEGLMSSGMFLASTLLLFPAELLYVINFLFFNR